MLSKVPYARRIGGSNFSQIPQNYKFESIKKAKQVALKKSPHTPLIDLGIGDPDGMPDESIIHTLCEAAKDPLYKGYADNGALFFQEAVGHYMQTEFNVSLMPETEIMHCIGAKAALTLLPAAFINPGDIVITTTPGYPVFATHAHYYGAGIQYLPLTPDNHFFPDIDSLSKEICERTKAIVVNYPNNPTGQIATYEFFQHLVSWARKWQILIIHDAAYAALTFNPQDRLSIFNIPQAKDCAIEVHSLSKSFNMTGYRIGWVCSSPALIKAYAHIKSHSDSGQFLAIQKAATQAIGQPHLTTTLIKNYERRLKALINVFNDKGFNLTMPKAGFFLYTAAPKQILTSKQTLQCPNATYFSEWLIQNTSIVTVPWDEAGNFIRLSATFNASTIDEEAILIENLKQRLEPYTFIF